MKNKEFFRSSRTYCNWSNKEPLFSQCWFIWHQVNWHTFPCVCVVRRRKGQVLAKTSDLIVLSLLRLSCHWICPGMGVEGVLFLDKSPETMMIKPQHSQASPPASSHYFDNPFSLINELACITSYASLVWELPLLVNKLAYIKQSLTNQGQVN